MISEAQQTRTISKIKIKGRLQKKGKFGLLAEPPLTPPPPTNLGPVIRSIFYCFIQIYTHQNMKQLYGVLLAHLIYLGNYGQNY